ncbi:MAG: tail fiber assembly protein [Rouxiella badensis]|uniref:tail fiber assembly protein n=1 Tax=Rouxiella badensis TaxID=1646377 RepID=UPI003C4C31A1
MSFEFKAEQQTVTAHHYDPETGEYLLTVDEVIPPHTGLPAHSTDAQLPEGQEGHAHVFAGDTWSLVSDHRGKTVYAKETGAALVVDALGDLADTVTELVPGSRFDIWNAVSGAWEVDTAAKLAADTAAAVTEKGRLMVAACLQVEIYGDAVALPEPSEDDTKMLAAWKAYRVALNKIDTSAPTGIVWPPIPAPDAANTAQ